MNHVLKIIVLFLYTTQLMAQVGIGTNNPHITAALDIASNSKGLLIPRLTTTERDLIASPATGLLIYNTTTNGIEFFNGTNWGAQMVKELKAQALLSAAAASNGSVPLLQPTNPDLANIVSNFSAMPSTTGYTNVTPVNGFYANQNGTTVAGSKIITMSSTAGFLPGAFIAEQGDFYYLEDGAKVVAVTATTVEMDKPAKTTTTSAVRFNVTNPNIDYGGNLVYGNGYNFINHFAARQGDYGPKQSVIKKIKFMTDAREFQGTGYAVLFVFQNTYSGNNVRVAINGQYISSDYITMSGSPAALQITFPNTGAFFGPDEIEIEYPAGLFHTQLLIPSNAKIWKPAPKPNYRVVGDSFIDNVYGFTFRAAEMLGGTVWNGGIGGTGYTAGYIYGHVDRIKSAGYAKFDCSIWYGTVNDASGNGNITSNALSAFQVERQKIGPGVPLIVFGCTINGNASHGDRLVYESKIKAAIDQTNDPDIYWVPITGDPSGAWFTNPGNWNTYNSGDNIHPNSAGYKFLAAKAYAKIVEILSGIN